MKYNETAFEAAVEIVASAMEENEVELSAAGGARVGEFFAAIYEKLDAITEGREEKPGCFEVYTDKAGEHRFRLKACNGEPIAESEGYSSRTACLKGVESVRRSVPGAEIKEI